MPPRKSKTSSVSSLPVILNIDDFKGDFSFDALFGNLVNEHLPSLREDEVDSADGHGIGGTDALPNGHTRTTSDATKVAQGLNAPLFPEVDALLSLFKDSCKELIELRKQIDGKLNSLKKEVSTEDAKHRKTLTELEKGVDGLFNSFARLDSRISSVGQTAAKVGDHLQSADAQRETASQTIELVKYLMEFNSSPGDLTKLSPLFSDDSRVAEAASIAQKLRSFAEEDISRAMPSVASGTTASRGLETAVGNLQEYCNELENRLLARFDAASQRRELSTMSECAKILSQFNRGTSAMQHYVATRPMFIDVEVMNSDANLVLGDRVSPNYVARGVSKLYKDITDTVRKEAATIMAVFPSPNDVMSILVQRVLEQRVTSLLDKLLEKPSLAHPRPMEEGGILLYLRVLAVSYEKTQELARDLRAVGCGDLDVEGLAESLFSSHKDEYPDYEKSSLSQLCQAKLEELRVESQRVCDPNGTIGRSKGASMASFPQEISVAAATEFVQWNEEAISRCTLFSSLGQVVRVFIPSVLNNPSTNLLRLPLFSLNDRPKVVGTSRSLVGVQDKVTEDKSKPSEKDVIQSRLRDNISYKDVLVSSSSQKSESEQKGNKYDNVDRGRGKKNIWEMHIPIENSRGLAYEAFDVQIASWGYVWNSCVITFKSEELMKDAWSNKSEELWFWFDRLAPLLNEGGVPIAFCLVELLQCSSAMLVREFLTEVSWKVGIIGGHPGIDFNQGRSHDGENFAKGGKISIFKKKLEREGINEGVLDFHSSGSREKGDYVRLGIKNKKENNERLQAQSDRSSEPLSPIKRLIPAVTAVKLIGLGNAKQKHIHNVTSISGDGDKARGSHCLLSEVGLKDTTGMDGELESAEGLKLICLRIGSPTRSASSLSMKSAPVGRKLIKSHKRFYNRFRERNFWLDVSGGESGSKSGRHLISRGVHPKISEAVVLSKGDCDVSRGRSLNRRNKRSLIRDALDHASVSTLSSLVFPVLMEEAMATWEISSILGISFKEGKEVFLQKIMDLEKGLSQGLGKQEKQRAVQKLASEKKPTFLFLQETKFEILPSSFLRRSGLNKLQGFVVSPAVGSSGGILSCWDDSCFELEDQYIHKRFIVVVGKFKSNQFRCGFIKVYGPSVEEEKTGFFEELGLFLNGCSNRDFPTVVRLDRFLVNVSFFSEFSDITQSLLPKSISDHNAIIMESGEDNWGKRLFRLFSYLMSEDGFEEKVVESIMEYKKVKKRAGILSILRNTKGAIKTWSRSRNQFPREQISVIEDKIHQIENSIQLNQFTNDDSTAELRLLRNELWRLYRIEEQIWFQNSREKWVKDGDRNSKFFHTCASIRRRLNTLNAINVEDILDCSFIANEGIDLWRKKGLKGCMLKVDFKKAYDMVDWDILFKIMAKMGFGSKWCCWIRKCVTTASVSVLVNGVPTDEFPIARGIRQGCSLSPLLFNFIGELFHLLLLKAVSSGLFSGLVVGKDETSLNFSHLQFADDLIIFCIASKTHVLNVKRVLRVFEVISGLKLNLTKSKLFGINISEEKVMQWANTIGCAVGYFPSKYLGLPLGAKRNSITLWDPVVQKFYKKALLGKWSWRFANERETVWKKVICIQNHFKEDQFGDKFQSLFEVRVGNGDRISFLFDKWAIDSPLKVVFSRLFVLSLNKNGKLNEFGEFRSSVWSWHVQMRRNLSDWEMVQYCDLMALIHNITLTHELTDGLVWRGNGDGIYSVNSSIKSCCPVSTVNSFWMRYIWRGLVPPRVEIDLFFMARCRLATWFLANFKEVSILKDSLITDPSLGDCCSNSRCSIIEIVSWSPPPKGFIKLNVDAAVNRDWRKSGVRVFLRGEDGSVMGSFQEAAGPGPPLLNELMAVKRGLTFFDSIHQRFKERLIVETDSKLAVEWVKNYDRCPCVYLNLVKDIVIKLRDLNGIIRWVSRSANVEADSLANAVTLATNVRAVFTCLLGQVIKYITDGLERARDGLTEAASLRERFVIGTSVSRRVAAAATSQAEAAAAAGETSFKAFMVAVQRSGSSVAIIHQYFANSISRLLLPVDGAHAAACEEMATAMSSAEGAACKGLQQCIETLMAEVERLLTAEQKTADYHPPDDGMIHDHRPTNACTRFVLLVYASTT
ncbi:Exocyst complex component 5 [Hibiscus syriacus]|uniref:Exocyst complex component 5 n=1 Tax=Hibiscus syriacus TaxID=106335 RepID=A0A6A2YQ50_HIBSY|nr:Exocyst complex component 5 [Hibiscus syriacus]